MNVQELTLIYFRNEWIFAQPMGEPDSGGLVFIKYWVTLKRGTFNQLMRKAPLPVTQTLGWDMYQLFPNFEVNFLQLILTIVYRGIFNHVNGIRKKR